jgi:hypothetical protein
MVQLVSHSVNGFDPARILGILLNLRTEVGYVIIHSPRGRKSGAAPHDIEEALACNWFAWCSGHEPQYGVLLGSEMEFSLFPESRLAREIKFDVAQLKTSGIVPFAMIAPEQRPHSGEQFFRAERLDEVIVRAHVQARDSVLYLALGCEHQHGHGVREPAEFGANSESVQLGHHDIQQYQVRFFLYRFAEAGLSIGRAEHAVAFLLEQVFQRDSHWQLVFNNQNAFHFLIYAVDFAGFPGS